MAKFQTPGFSQIEAPNVPTDRMTSKSDTAKETFLGAVNLVGGVLKDKERQAVTEELESDIESTARAVSVADEAQAHSGLGAGTFDAVRGDVNLIEGAPEDFNQAYAEVMKTSSDEFRSIASAVAQGSTSQSAGAIIIETKLKELTARHPAFADELRATARRLLPYDPTGYHLKQILDIKETSQSKTFAQKQEEEAVFISNTLGLPLPSVRHAIAKELHIKRQREIMSQDMQLGQMTATNYISADLSESGPLMDKFFVEQKQLLNQGGNVNPEEQLLLLSRAKAQHRSDIVNNIMKGTGGAGLDAATTKYLNESLDNLYKPIEDAIKTNDFGEILKRKNETLMELDRQYGRRVFPRLTRMTNALGEKLTGTILDQMANFANTDQWMLYAKQQPVLWEAIQGAQMTPSEVANKGMDVYEKVLTGQPLTESDKDWLKAVEPIVFHPKNDPEVRKRYLENLGSQESRGVGWLAQKGKRAFAAPTDVEWMKREWKQTVPALQTKIADEMVKDRNFTILVKDDGTFTAASVRARGQNPKPFYMPEVEQLNYFIKATKNGWAGDFGVANAGEALKQMTRDIKQTAENLEGTEDPSLIETTINSTQESVTNVGKKIAQSMKEYEDIVNGRVKPEDPNKQLQRLIEQMKGILDTEVPKEFGKDIRK